MFWVVEADVSTVRDYLNSNGFCSLQFQPVSLCSFI